MPRYERTFSPKREQRALEQNVADFARQVSAISWLDGVLLRDVALINGSNVINHKLGHAISGWFLLRPRAGSAISMPVETASDDKTLTLAASASSTVDLWVF